MDTLGELVSQKIGEAIKRKLMDITVFEEEDLPEYIMVMVANKRSRAQMEDDLHVFLGDQTTAFMDWMEKTISHMQNSPFDEIESGTQGKYLKGIPSSTNTDCDVSMSDFLALEANEDDLLDCELKDEVNNVSVNTLISAHHKSVPISAAHKSVPISAHHESVPISAHHESVPISEKKLNICSIVPKEESNDMVIKSPNPIQHKKTVPCSAVFPVKREKKSPDETKSDESKQCFGSVASVIRISDRKSSVPFCRQANKLLLFRAMDAANKSVRENQKNVNCSQLSSTTNFLDKPKIGNFLEKQTILPVSKDVCPYLNKSMESTQKIMSNDNASRQTSNNEKYLNSVNIYEGPLEVCDAIDVTSKCEKSEVLFDYHHDTTEIMEDSRQTATESATRFVVTLDGLKSGSFSKKRDLSEVSSDEEMDSSSYSRAVEGDDFVQLEVDNMQISEDSNKRQKFNEKCRFWPACKNGNKCSFHHPITSCKAFPNCKYGDRCLYIHPNCKFDALCSRKDCPYTHASKRKLSPKVLPVSKRIGKLNGVCKFIPNCKSKNCPYNHPKLCRYGTQCTVFGCIFSHSVPSRDQLKWRA